MDSKARQDVKPCAGVCFCNGHRFMISLEKIQVRLFAWHIGPLKKLEGETLFAFVKEHFSLLTELFGR